MSLLAHMTCDVTIVCPCKAGGLYRVIAWGIFDINSSSVGIYPL